MRIAGFAGALIVLLASVPMLPLPPRQVRKGRPATHPTATAVRDSTALGRQAGAAASVRADSAPGEGIREVPVDTLADVAVANYDANGSEIYYNPAALQQLGPQVAAFMMAHERGHIHLRHTRANALLAGRTALDSVLQGRELAADCYASEKLGSTDPAAVFAAARFFGRLGSTHFDAAHPTGAQRAAHILACLPSTAPDSANSGTAPNPAIVLDSSATRRLDSIFSSQ